MVQLKGFSFTARNDFNTCFLELISTNAEIHEVYFRHTSDVPEGLTPFDASLIVENETTGVLNGAYDGDKLYIYTDDDIYAGSNAFKYFYNCSALTLIDLSSFNTSNVTNMQYMFNHCESLTSLNLSNFDTSNVTDMQYMFYYCSKLETIYVSHS